MIRARVQNIILSFGMALCSILANAITLDPNSPKNILKELQAQNVTGAQLATMLDADQVLDFFDYLKTLPRFDGQKDGWFLQQLNEMLKAQPWMKEYYQADLKEYGSQLASPRITTMVHEYLKKYGVVDWKVPVYKLQNQNFYGFVDPFAIWINELQHDDFEFMITAAHEAAHWFLWHYLLNFIMKNPLSDEAREREADAKVFEILTPQQRQEFLRRSHEHLQSGQGEPNMYDSYARNIIDIAREHGVTLQPR